MLLGHILLAVTAAVPQSTGDTVPLFDNLGTHSRQITTAQPLAQRYFDQGLRLVYGFNHVEAIRAFTRATQIDPTCAMCYWGIAYAHGPHVNAGMDSAAGLQAFAAIRKAIDAGRGAAAWERAYISALATRYAAAPPDDRAALDSAYAEAMGQVAARYPDDLDAATLYAEALMNLRPWNYWTRSGDPQPGTEEIVRTLERVIQRDQNHPGACHFYIHAVEAVAPELAVPCAERLAQLMPGVGHMVHMPAHIYIRVGRYADAITANEHAVHTDETYIDNQRPQGLYRLGYYPHNYHFLAFAATMAGRRSQALQAARALATKVPAEFAEVSPEAQSWIVFPTLTLTTFGAWDEVLAMPAPPESQWFGHAMAQYARGVALAALGRGSEARPLVQSIAAAAAAAPEGDPKTALMIAQHALLGEINARAGNDASAVTHFEEAARLEDDMLYYEPPVWFYPIRHSLGASLLRAGRYADAERVYREDLRRFPLNGWSLFGLSKALRAAGRVAEADEVDAQFLQAWIGADVQLTASRF
jgi:tetratricopeptide (TPR) repeat protein